MTFTANELRGLIKGQCLPGDIRKGEYIPEYLARKFSEMQQKLDAISAKAIELCGEAAHVYQKYNITQMPDRDLVDHQTIQELSDLIRSGTHDTADKAG